MAGRHLAPECTIPFGMEKVVCVVAACGHTMHTKISVAALLKGTPNTSTRTWQFYVNSGGHVGRTDTQDSNEHGLTAGLV